MLSFWSQHGRFCEGGNTLEKEREDLTIAGCWVHARRRFDEALAVVPKERQKESASYLILKQIQTIYRKEGKLKDLSSEERLSQRQVAIKPLVDALFAYLKQHESEVGTEKLKDAFSYALNQEKYLRVFLTDGDVPMDNNASERAIRGFCVGKKNWQIKRVNSHVANVVSLFRTHGIIAPDCRYPFLRNRGTFEP